MYQPPKAARKAAQQVLEWKRKYPNEIKGMTRVGWQRAKQLASGKPVSAKTVKAMAQFNRHRSNYRAAMQKKSRKPWREAAIIAWRGWGGTSGIDWARRESKKMGRKKNPKFYVLYDVLSDYSLEPVSGKSQYGSLEHAKKRGVKDNKGQRVTWRLDSKWKGGRAWKGANKHEELIYLIVERDRNPCPPTKKKKARKKNPLGFLVIAVSPTGKQAAYLGSVQRPRGEAFAMTKRNKALHFGSQEYAREQLERYAPVLPKRYDNWQFAIIPKETTTAEAAKQISGKGKRRGNPVGPTQREVDSATNLFKDFTGEHPERMQNVRLPVPKTGLAIGELDGVLYTTVRDGKRESYIHEFKKGSRPLLASSHDGASLHILGGEYEFTERGIEDK